MPRSIKHAQLLIPFLLLLACSTPENKKEYDVKVGETFEIYYKNNSCCGYCWNLEELDNIELVGKVTIEESNTDGGSSTYMKAFRATSVGIDTLKSNKYAMSDSCNFNSKNVTSYLIKVSK